MVLRIIRAFITVVVGCMLLFSSGMASQRSITELRTIDLQCENLTNPLGLDKLTPRFSWRLLAGDRGLMQQAYEIRVATDSMQLVEGKGNIWTSGKTMTDQSTYVPYDGPRLQTATKYYWQVRVYDNFGRISPWSDVAYWRMGLLNATDWKAEWIKQDPDLQTAEVTNPIFRHEFKSRKTIKSATAYVTSFGFYEAFINGQRIGDAYFTPGWTSYANRLQYQVYDVTTLVSSGNNAIGVMLGFGWYKSPLGWGARFNSEIKDREMALLFQLQLVYSDGSTEIIGSDERWKQHVGAIQHAEIYDGETNDARKEPKRWMMPGFNAAAWKPVMLAHHGKNMLVASESEPVRRREALKPREISQTAEGDWLIDFGQNMTGYVVVNVAGRRGDSIVVEHAEILDQQGNFYTTNLRTAKSKNVYVLAGDGEEQFYPHFTFHGFRYIRIKGLSAAPKVSDLTAFALYSDMGETGTFTSSHPLINQLQKNIVWGQKGNFLDVPTDCPQRDERLGWTGDAQVFGSTAAFNMNVHRFFVKWLKDLSLDQLENGSVPYVIPHVLDDSVSSGAAGWADAATIIPWQMYMAYGDKQILIDQYESMKGWVNYMNNQSTDFLWKPGSRQTADWLHYTPQHFLDAAAKSAFTSSHLIAQSFFAHSTSLLVKTAGLLGKQEDVVRYSDLLEQVRKAFVAEYVTSNGNLISESQTAYVLGLNFDLIPAEQVPGAVKRLVQNIEDYGGHLTTGFLGTPYLCSVLARYGHIDVAYKLLMNERYPSWLYPVTKGATTIWERWDGIRPDGTFQNPDMNSFNHYAYGAIGDWMYTTIAGIQSDSIAVGYKKSVIKPIPGGGLTFAKATLNTYYGQLVSDWRLTGEEFQLDVVIPPNTSSSIHLPATHAAQVTEGGKPIANRDDLHAVRVVGKETIIQVGAGSYRFTVKESAK